MKITQVTCLALGILAGVFADVNASPDHESPQKGRASRSSLKKRQDFSKGEPNDGKGKGATFSSQH